MNDINLIRSHLRSLEAELQVLKARMGEVGTKEPDADRSFAQLYGVVRGQADSTEEDIDAVLYQGAAELLDED
jgi:hypothetical protein